MVNPSSSKGLQNKQINKKPIQGSYVSTLWKSRCFWVFSDDHCKVERLRLASSGEIHGWHASIPCAHHGFQGHGILKWLLSSWSGINKLEFAHFVNTFPHMYAWGSQHDNPGLFVSESMEFSPNWDAMKHISFSSIMNRHIYFRWKWLFMFLWHMPPT